jgi:hypothetical protein
MDQVKHLNQRFAHMLHRLLKDDANVERCLQDIIFDFLLSGV